MFHVLADKDTEIASVIIGIHVHVVIAVVAFIAADW